MKGRKRDAPGMQALKGNPGKRKSAAEKQLIEAERMARLMATAPGSENDPLAPPQFLNKRFKPALAVWKEYAPRLHYQNMLDQVYRLTFSTFCIWSAEFVIANEDILKKGYSVMVKTISGDKMPRENPSVSRRSEAMKWVMQLSEKFGFTPLDQHRLLREMSAMAPPPPPRDLFGNSGGDQPEGDAVGTMDSMDSLPPKQPLN